VVSGRPSVIPGRLVVAGLRLGRLPAGVNR
jgi:hypothetical protein